ncbi:SH3 domain-containing protein [Salinarimonas chemoclinalis]|uniref:SH3 domain-containing protein n=1 Tax=Salinarimonas chemoclinalis TaxID=3241599 RepID=UPI003556B18F
MSLPAPRRFRPAALASLARLALCGVVLGGMGAANAIAQRAPMADVVPGVEHCVVNVRADDALNLRGGPGAGNAIVARLPYGACGVVVSGPCSGNWCPVEDGHHAGFVHARYIAQVSPALYCTEGVAKGDRLTLRAFPSFESRALHTLGPATCSIAFLPFAREGWQKVRVAGYEGWVPRANLSGQ